LSRPKRFAIHAEHKAWPRSDDRRGHVFVLLDLVTASGNGLPRKVSPEAA
jgi:hypothetical protein